METCIKKFTEIDLNDIDEVGYKNASIGKMMRHLIPNGILIPNGFAITAEAYRIFLSYNNLNLLLKVLMDGLDKRAFSNLNESCEKARKMIMDGKFPSELSIQIIDAYDYLFDLTQAEVAVRSSVLSSHLSDAAAGGLNDSFLHVQGHGALLYAIRQCFASVYTERSVRHAVELGYDPNATVMAVGIQKMIRADKGASGVGYTLHPHADSDDMICLKAIWGLGELINQETIEPDEYVIFKPSLKMISPLLVEKELGSKHKMMIYANEDDDTNQTLLKDTPIELQQSYVLNEEEIKRLAHWTILLDDVYSRPMCFEWAKDGKNHQLYLLQVSPFIRQFVDHQ